jgi:hypothetical protein
MGFYSLFQDAAKECPSAAKEVVVACTMAEWAKSLVLSPVLKIKYFEIIFLKKDNQRLGENACK